MYHTYNKFYSDLHPTGKCRQLPAIDTSHIRADFSTNDYLNLSRHEAVLKAAYDAGQKYGVGATGSRLLSGNNELFESFEKQIALDKRTEDALILSSGFQANLSVLASLLDKNVLKSQALVFFDRFNHASLYQAAFLSSCALIRYTHNDLDHLNELLNDCKNDPRPKFIVTESVFSMDGDIAPLQKIISLSKQHNAFLYIDEAHATGIMGKNGYGLSTLVDWQNIPHLIMGTFSKAIGSSGAYVACSKNLKNYLINKTPGFIYSTAPSPMVMGATAQAWSMIRNYDEKRTYLSKLANYCREKLKENGFDIGQSQTPIIPIMIGEENRTLEIKNKLYNKGILVSAIRPPTVPLNTSRLRLALTIKHTREDIDFLMEELIGL